MGWESPSVTVTQYQSKFPQRAAVLDALKTPLCIPHTSLHIKLERWIF